MELCLGICVLATLLPEKRSLLGQVLPQQIIMLLAQQRYQQERGITLLALDTEAIFICTLMAYKKRSQQLVDRQDRHQPMLLR